MAYKKARRMNNRKLTEMLIITKYLLKIPISFEAANFGAIAEKSKKFGKKLPQIPYGFLNRRTVITD